MKNKTPNNKPKSSQKQIAFILTTHTAMVVASTVLILLMFLLIAIKKPSVAVQDISTVKSEVGKLMILPTDEEPTLAAVTDKKQVKDPFIAKKAENGDQILIYANNKVAIIYRPKINKIVATGDLFADPALAEADGATITVLNGSNDVDKTKQIINELATLYPKADVSDGGKTNKQDFPTTIVIDNSQKKDNLVDAIAQTIKGKRGVVPLSEGATTSDLMIIVGKD